MALSVGKKKNTLWSKLDPWRTIFSWGNQTSVGEVLYRALNIFQDILKQRERREKIQRITIENRTVKSAGKRA